jgi:Tfp pilus assembly protein PilN
MRAINLIPADQREGGGGLAGRSGGAALIVLGLIAGLAILVVLYGGAHRSESKSHAELTTVDAELASAQAQVGRLAPFTSFIAMADQRIEAVSSLVASRFDWSHAFNELGRVLPRDASLTTLHGQIAASTGAVAAAPSATVGASTTPTSATPPGSTPVFTITGCATSQSEVAQTLQRLRLIDGVTEVTLQSSAKASTAPGSTAAAASGGSVCGPTGATFNATITFDALPIPLVGAPGAGAPGASPSTGAPGAAGAGSPAGTQAVPVSTEGASK